MMLGIKPDAYFTRDVHGILGQIRPDTHPDVRDLPKEQQVCSYQVLACIHVVP